MRKRNRRPLFRARRTRAQGIWIDVRYSWMVAPVAAILTAARIRGAVFGPRRGTGKRYSPASSAPRIQTRPGDNLPANIGRVPGAPEVSMEDLDKLISEIDKLIK